MLCPSLSVSLSVSVSASLSLSVYSPSSHMVRRRNFIFGVGMYTCPSKSRRLISEIYEHFLEIHILFTSYSCALTYGPLKLSSVPKYQMSSGPYGPNFNNINSDKKNRHVTDMLRE